MTTTAGERLTAWLLTYWWNHLPERIEEELERGRLEDQARLAYNAAPAY